MEAACHFTGLLYSTHFLGSRASAMVMLYIAFILLVFDWRGSVEVSSLHGSKPRINKAIGGTVVRWYFCAYTFTYVCISTDLASSNTKG
jgi:hypothetical protein